MQSKFSRQILEKYSNINSHENPSSGSRVATYGRTERHDDATGLFLKFCENV